MGSRVKELRVARGMSQEVLGQILVITQQTISKIENGKYDIPTDLLIGLASFFNVTTDYILGISDIKRNLEGQIKVNKTLDDNYELVMQYNELNKINKKTLNIILSRLCETQREKQND